MTGLDRVQNHRGVGCATHLGKVQRWAFSFLRFKNAFIGQVGGDGTKIPKEISVLRKKTQDV